MVLIVDEHLRNTPPFFFFLMSVQRVKRRVNRPTIPYKPKQAAPGPIYSHQADESVFPTL